MSLSLCFYCLLVYAYYCPNDAHRVIVCVSFVSFCHWFLSRTSRAKRMYVRTPTIALTFLLSSLMTMAEGDAVPSMESLVQELASTRVDTYNRPKRNEVIQSATERLVESPEDRRVLASLDGES